jgi:glycosyltransferase involved in cell wall biosynthesis
MLLVSMYPLDRGLWGPTVRITHLRDALLHRVDLDLVDGYRGARRLALARYATSGRLRGLDGIYVETSTFLPAETDLVFLGLARSLGIPVLTYVRDAYQLFDDYGPATTARQRAARAAFRPMIRALRAVSSRMAFPTIGLAEAVLGAGGADAVLLPPGSPPPIEVAADPDANRLLFVGDARLSAQGADRLIEAVARARNDGAAVGLTVVCRPGQEPPQPHPDWLRIERAEGDAIAVLLPDVVATVIPRPRNAYNDLALPIKLFDYLAYGRPLLVTDCTEQAAVVKRAGAGVVMGDDPKAMAAAIRRVADAPEKQRQAWSASAHEAARDASWEHRAQHIVDIIRDRT